MPQQPLALSTPSRNLVLLTIARGITWTGFLIAIIFGIEVLNFQLYLVPIFLIIVVMGLFNVATWWRLGWLRSVTEAECLVHLLIDVIGLTAIFYFTGGSTNPVITYYIVPITIAAATLPVRYTILTTVTAFGGYSALMLFYQPIPELSRHIAGTGISLHVLGMWLNFALCASLITYFVFKMARALRRRDRTLSKTRETALRNEQILAVASQAAGTAHELGTPLGTMAVLLGEMKEDADSDILREDITLLQRQVEQCKAHLRSLVATAERRRVGPLEHQDVQAYLERVIEKWLVIRPDVTHRLTCLGRRHAIIPTDDTLQQALLNLLNNAADANPQNIDITLDWDEQQVIVDIRDHGAGVPMDIADQLGQTFVSTKSKGMGIGLFLTHATINRFGGSVSLYNHEEGGTLTEVTLPRVDSKE
ncbi:ATP-binding protein [Larsenimonas suaedae]|uniref:histidine kinase n=1 Tax=Larsenimonas suaedae TaxID=1851019 RepID=A0ABU1GW31_9GAMM|nr:ATP-binding protein [Larsenimonas suaedae]MCM2971325.1 ATP-binding protein [Larsenimonas suaedae]MDR5896035.1 ATP-binding protein [Larsenimonas suaedae]